MLHVSCTYCRAPINLSDGELAEIVQKAGGKKSGSAPVTCPNCRRGNKVPMQRIVQAYRQAGSPPPPESPSVEAQVAEPASDAE